MGVRVRYKDGSERWCESCADPNDNGGSVVQGGTEHNKGGGSMAGSDAQPANSASQGAGGNGVPGTQAAAATASDAASRDFGSFYPQTNASGGYASPAAAAPTSSAATAQPAGGAGTQTAAGTQKTNQEWAFDPTQPNRAVSAGMSQLGLPTYGPAADFFSRYGLAGVSQALADGSFATPGAFQGEMTNRLSGGESGMDAGDMVRSLMGGEGLAKSLNGANPGISNPTDAARAAYISNMESDPNALAQLLTGTLTGKGVNMSSSLSGLLGAFLGNIGQRRYNTGVPQNDTLGFLGKILGY